MHSVTGSIIEISDTFDEQISKLLTNCAILRGKISLLGRQMVGGIDGRSTSVACVLENVIETLVHISVVSESKTTYTIIYCHDSISVPVI